jgi:hypothetical protein
MKLILSAVLGLMAGGSSVKAVNVLFNPFLDQVAVQDQLNATPVGWTVQGTKSISGPFLDGGDSETFCNVSPPSDPNGYGFFFKPFSGSINTNSALNDLLTVALFQDNAATPGTKFTLSANVSCEANYSGLFATNSPVPKTVFFVNFYDSGGNLLATNEYDLVANGMSTAGVGGLATSILTTPQYTAPAGTAKVRAGEQLRNVYSTTGQQSTFADNFDLEAIAPPGSPVITNQPAQVSVAPGGTATFTVGIQNPTGVSYQWQHANGNISDGGEYSGTTNSTLTVSNVAAADVGHYRVFVSNSNGSVYSADAVLTIVTFDINPVTSITGRIGDTYQVDYTTSLSSPNWIPLSTNKLTTSPFPVMDPTPARNGPRFYRAVFLH